MASDEDGERRPKAAIATNGFRRVAFSGELID